MSEEQEKIEIGYRNIGSQFGVDYHHKFLVYTDKNGGQHTISGWVGPEKPGLPYGKIHIENNIPYDKNNPDHPENTNALGQKQYRELITEGKDLSKTWEEMTKNAITKDDKYPYDPILQNSNTLADNLLAEAHLHKARQSGMTGHLAPGSGNALDEKIIPKNPMEAGISENLGKVFSATGAKELTEKQNEKTPAVSPVNPVAIKTTPELDQALADQKLNPDERNNILAAVNTALPKQYAVNDAYIENGILAVQYINANNPSDDRVREFNIDQVKAIPVENSVQAAQIQEQSLQADLSARQSQSHGMAMH